jgi:multidrug transporter EmrE-like cation transporter
MWILLAAICAALTPILLKQYTTNKNSLYVFGAVVSFAVLIYAYVRIFETESLTVSYPLVKIIAIFLVLAVGVFIFKETLSFQRILGIILGLIAIGLLAF